MIGTLIACTVLAVSLSTGREVNKCPENVQTLPTFDSNRVLLFIVYCIGTQVT